MPFSVIIVGDSLWCSEKKNLELCLSVLSLLETVCGAVRRKILNYAFQCYHCWRQFVVQ